MKYKTDDLVNDGDQGVAEDFLALFGEIHVGLQALVTVNVEWRRREVIVGFRWADARL